MPPKFSSFYLPPNATDLGDWITPPSFRNRAKEVEALNKLIKKLNEVAGLAYPELNLYCMRFFKKSGTKQHKFDTRDSFLKFQLTRTGIWMEMFCPRPDMCETVQLKIFKRGNIL